MSRLDYCNSVLADLPSTTLKPLTAVLYTAARLVKSLGPRDHITPALRELHWLPIQSRIQFKLSLLMFNIVNNTSPSYMSSMVVPCAAIKAREGLRSATRGDFAPQRTIHGYGGRSFFMAGPDAWNKLSKSIRTSKTVHQFKSRLKTFLFAEHYETNTRKCYCNALLCKTCFC